MPTTRPLELIQRKVTATRTVNGVVETRVVISPAGVMVTPGESLPLLALNWPLYANQPVENCQTTPTGPDPLGPTFAPDFSLGVMTLGTEYRKELPNSIGVPASGQTITNVTATQLPNYLVFDRGSDLTTRFISGFVPANATAVSIRITLTQSDLRTYSTTFIIGTLEGEIYPYIKHIPGFAQEFRLGADGGRGAQPIVEIISAPPGFADLEAHLTRPFETDFIQGKKFYYDYVRYPVGPNGIYWYKVTHFGRVVYFSFEQTSQAQEVIPAIQNSPPDAEALAGQTTLAEGQIGTYGVINSATQAPIDGYTYSATGVRAGDSFDPATRKLTTISNNTTGDGYTVTIVATKAGSPTLQLTVTVGDATAAAPVVTRVAYSWAKNNPPTVVSNARILVNVTRDPLELAFQVGSNAKSGYTAMNSGSFENGTYNRLADLAAANSGQVLTLYLRRVGTTTDLFSVTLPAFPASGTVPLTVVFPIEGTGSEDISSESDITITEP